MDITIEHWKQEDIPHINRLIEAALNEFVAPTLLRNGIRTFFRDVNKAELRRSYTKYEGYTARSNGNIVGFIAADANRHIAFLFVSGGYHKKASFTNPRGRRHNRTPASPRRVKSIDYPGAQGPSFARRTSELPLHNAR